jgi:hypothetical protein
MAATASDRSRRHGEAPVIHAILDFVDGADRTVAATPPQRRHNVNTTQIQRQKTGI